MTFDLPGWLRSGIDALHGEESGRQLALASARLSERYRAGDASSATIASKLDATAYIATRLPATFAAISAALDAALRQVPQFRPRSLLDIGCGPGTASFAALGLLPEMEKTTLLDSNPYLIEAGRALSAISPHGAIAEATWIKADLLAREAAVPSADLIVVAYAMVEMAPAAAINLALDLWRRCDGLLLIVEPGTPSGYRTILRMRNALISGGADVIAPCPGNVPCPLLPPDWCHFSQRLARSRLHRQAKSASAPFEDERFSYVAVARSGQPGRVQRILAPTIETKAGIALKLCTQAGLVAEKVPSRDREGLKRARKLSWGDVFLKSG